MCSPISRRGLLKASSGVAVAAALGILPDPNRWTTTPLAPEGGARSAATRFVPVTPARLADTRFGSVTSRRGQNWVRVHVAGRAGVPSEARAVVVTVTATGGASPGFVSVVPASATTTVPGTTLLSHGAHQTRVHCGFVQLGGGALDIYQSASSASLELDVVGYFEPAESATSGRLETIDPRRILDTSASAAPFHAGEQRTVTAGAAVPVDATAVVIQLSATGTMGHSGWRMFTGSQRPPGPQIRVEAGERSDAMAVVPMHHGPLRVHSQDGGHLAVDVIGYFTGARAPDSTAGLFVPEQPYRALDTRLVGQRIPQGTAREVTAGPQHCSALALNLITLAASADGASVVWGAGDPPPTSTTVAYTRGGGAMSNFSVHRAGSRGAAIGTFGGAAHAVADIYGWFTGSRSTNHEPVRGAQPHGIFGVEMESFADEWFDYGISALGRPLRAFRHGSGPRQALLTTGIHGDEHTGTSVLADVVTRSPIPGWTLWLVPVANPDARALNTRFVDDVDMNRDFPIGWTPRPTPTRSGCITTRTGPAPFSLTESHQLAQAMTTGPFRRATLSISHHDNYNWVAPQKGSSAALRQLADDYAAATGLRTPGQGGPVVPTSPESTRVDGGFETFAHGLGMSSILVENKAGYIGEEFCAGTFGVAPAPEDVLPHFSALSALLTDARLPVPRRATAGRRLIDG